MFAFVIYDKQEHTLYGARDYFGIKPFYYGTFGKTLLFGSEIKSFLPHPDFKKEVNPDALKMYLSSHGNSIIVFQTDSIVKIHIHNYFCLL